jgi:AcrR family transcriptional regulator
VTTAPLGAAPTSRGRRRREAVLDAAAALFFEHGFHGTSIDDIGERAGISGPGVYRHFPSKDAVLAAVTDRLWERLKPALAEAEIAEGPDVALTTLLNAHVDMALEEPTALVLLERELRHLTGRQRSSASRRRSRYVDAWADAMCRLQPDLTTQEAQSAALGIHGLLDSAARNPGILDASHRRQQLRRLARAALDEALRP